MSDAREGKFVLANVDIVEACAAKWIQRRQFWDWSAEDQAQLDTWLAQSSIHLVTYLRLEAVWARAGRLAALRMPMREAKKSPEHRNFSPLALKSLAALIVIAVVGAAGISYVFRSQDEVYTTPVGGHRTIALADHSLVELNTDTVLTVRGRTARLEKGEAYFQIKHNTAHPFVVVAGNHRIADLGTKFLVRAQPGRLEVSLVEGKALVESTGNVAQPQAALLTPGDVAIATADFFCCIANPKWNWRTN